ncbi:MAG: hypothetical protein H6834_01300 [Planctomycetes bacterium]|nr:hypothetical protein [Planctomycetota bacterium]
MLCHITTHIEGRVDDDRLSSVGGMGFPTICAIDGDGKVLANLAGGRDVASFSAMMTSAKETMKALVELEKKASEGDAEALNDLIVKKVELARIDGDEAKKLLENEKLGDEAKKKLRGVIAAAKVEAIMKNVTRDPKTQVAAGAEFAKLIAEGFDFPDLNTKLNAHYFASMHAEEKVDVELMKKCVKAFKDAEGINPRFLEQLDKRLADLEKKASGGDSDDGEKKNDKK